MKFYKFKMCFIIKNYKNYNSIEALEIELNTYVFNNALKTLTNLTIIKCNPNILNLLPLNNYHENNITTLIIQNGTKN